MIEVKNNIKMYEYNNFYVYIIEESNTIEYYLQYKGYGVIKHIYGIEKEKGIKELLKLIKNTIYEDSYNMLDEIIDFEGWEE